MKSKWTAFTLSITCILVLQSCFTGAAIQGTTQAPRPAIRQDLFVDIKTGDNPSHMLGRFVSGSVPEAMSATRATQTRCSSLIDVKVSKSNSSYDEVFKAGANGQIGGSFNNIEAFSFKEGGESIVRIHYYIKQVMEAVPRPEFFDCCEQYSDQCSGHYVSRFVYGGGTMYSFAGDAGSLSGGAQQVGFDVKWGAAWEQSSKFDDIYFGFELSPVQSTGGVCASNWQDGVPPSRPGGRYFIGTSHLTILQTDARTAAETDARIKVVNELLGQQLSQSLERSTIEGIQSDSNAMQAASSGLAKLVEVACYGSYKTHATPKGNMYQTEALLFLPDDAIPRAKTNIIDELLRYLPASKPERTQFEQLRRELGDNP